MLRSILAAHRVSALSRHHVALLDRLTSLAAHSEPRTRRDALAALDAIVGDLVMNNGSGGGGGVLVGDFL